MFHEDINEYTEVFQLNTFPFSVSTDIFLKIFCHTITQFQYLFNFIFASKSTHYLTNFCTLYEILWKQLNVKILLSFFCGENSCHYINVTSHYHKLSLKLDISFWYGRYSNGLGVTSLRQSC